MITPYDFQLADMNNLLAHDANGFVVAETGAGKTVIGAATAHATGLPTKLIIAPQGTHEHVWKRTILELDPEAHVDTISGSAPGKENMNDLEWKRPGYYLITPQLFTRWDIQKTVRPDVALLDEAHLVSNRETTGGKKLMKLSAGHRIPLSGTIFRNKFENIWTLARWVYPDRHEAFDIADISFHRWVAQFCETTPDYFSPSGRKVVGEIEPGAYAGLVPCWVQHFKREECCEFHPEGFLHGLPEPIIMQRFVEMVPAQKKAIAQMETDYVAWLDDEAKNRKVLHVKLPLMQSLRLSQITLGVPSIKEVQRQVKVDKVPQFNSDGTKKMENHKTLYFEKDCESPKLDEIIEIHHKVNEPMVVSVNSLEFAMEAVRRLNALGIRTFEWSSRASQVERDAALDDFRAGKYDIIFGVTEAIGTGIDGLQDASGVLVRTNVSRDLTSETQLLGRLDRRGQIRTEGVLVFDIIAKGSTDQGIISSQLARRLALNKSQRRALRKEAA